ncbi:MAG: hypothetical protein ACD_79C00437G0001 [uncultured bacterium]|nr:MAG: hypothetical protein ACD_79C00437G0001 [uncultured bacterium]
MDNIGKLRKTGLTLSSIFLLFIFLFLWRNPDSFLLKIFIVLFSMSFIQVLFFVRSVKYTEKFMIKLGNVLGWINLRIIIFILFVLVITPMALIMKIIGKKTLDNRIDKTVSSYWKEYEGKLTPEQFNRQF